MGGVFLFCASWAHSKSRSYNLKNCNFFFGASLVPGLRGKWELLVEENTKNIPPLTRASSLKECKGNKNAGSPRFCN